MTTITRILGLFITVVCLSAAQGQTILSGNISGTWSPSGNPYIISDNATVQGGQTLTIQPGVIVWIGQGVSLTVYGGIQAIGTAAQHIVFQAPISSQFWNTISVNNGLINQFTYCDFANATNAIEFASGGTSVSNDVSYCTFQDIYGGITMVVDQNNRTRNLTVQSCTFSNCFGTAISGVAFGYAANCSPGSSGTILSAIRNCSFSSVSNGCSFNVYGYSGCGWSGYGYGNVQLMNNIFNRITNSAISLIAGNNAGSSPALLMNNIIVNASNGVVFQDPWDAKMQSSILVGCTNATTVSGSLSRSISYNDFYNNAINFTGYPSTYGTIILVNRNGTPCDLLYNIFSNPSFVSGNDFSLQPTSPCIDAGDGSAANYDSYFPPSQRTVINDIGAYGGPDAGGWIYAPPTTAFALSIFPYVGVTINPPSAGHYKLDYASELTGINNWIQITNTDLTGPFTYVEPMSNLQRYYRAVKLY